MLTKGTKKVTRNSRSRRILWVIGAIAFTAMLAMLVIKILRGITTEEKIPILLGIPIAFMLSGIIYCIYLVIRVTKKMWFESNNEKAKRKMIVERSKSRRRTEEELREEFSKASKLRLEIFSLLGKRTMTGEEAYMILLALESQTPLELRETRDNLVEGEERLRVQVDKKKKEIERGLEQEYQKSLKT